MKHTHLALATLLVLMALVVTTRMGIVPLIGQAASSCIGDSECPADSVCFSGRCINTANIDQATIINAWNIVNAQYSAAIAACGQARGDYATARTSYAAAVAACQTMEAACRSSSSSAR